MHDFVFTRLLTELRDPNAVDSLGFPFFAHCTKASVSDDVGLIEMLSDNIDYFKSKPVNIPKITILLDNGYHPEKLTIELKKIYPAIMTKIRFKLSPKPSKAQKENLGKTGFIPVKARWGKGKNQLLDGKMQKLGQKFDANLRKCHSQGQSLFCETAA